VRPTLWLKFFSFCIFIVGLAQIGDIFEKGISATDAMLRISGGLLIVASIAIWIKKNKTSWIICVTALLSSFLLQEAYGIIVLRGFRKWTYGFFALMVFFVLLSPDVMSIFFKKKE
jgi:hypothetical protein